MPNAETPGDARPKLWHRLKFVPEEVEPAQLKLLFVVAFALFFENYDMSLLGLNLHLLEAEFGLAESQSGIFTASIRLGALPAFFLVPLADRIGRRRLFLISVVGLSLGAALTAFAQTATQFVVCQLVSRSFIICASATAFVIITEELPAAHRGWGVGMLGAVAALGYGLGALLHPAAQSTGAGWRGLYLFGIAPIVLMPWFGRRIPETKRFVSQIEAVIGEQSIVQAMRGAMLPIRTLFRRHPERALGLVLIGMLGTAGHSVAFQYSGKFLQGMKGWTPGEYSGMFLMFGLIGTIASPALGGLSDRFGRRAMCAIVLAGFPVSAAAFYLGPDAWIPFAWIGMVFLSTISALIIRALSNEVFPTSARATAGGILSLVETLGAAFGLYLFALLTLAFDDFGLSVVAVSLFCILVTPALVLFPATQQRELETITADYAQEETPKPQADA